MRLSAFLIIMILLGCGKESHLLLDSAKIYRDKAKDKEKAYETLAKGLYEENNAKLTVIPEAWFVIGELHYDRKEYNKMNTAFDKVLELEKPREKKEFTSKIIAKRDRYYVAFYDEAREKFNASIPAADNEKKSLLEEAKSSIENAMIIDKRISAYIIMGKIKAQLDDDSAVDDFMKAIELEPKNKDVMFDLANYYYNKKDYNKSAETYGKVIELDANDVEAIKFQAYSYQNNQKYKEAAQSYAQYLESNPDDSEIKQYLVQMYYLDKQYDKSISLTKELIQSEGESESVYNTVISAFYMKINDAITNKKKDEQKALLSDAVMMLENAVKKDEYMMSAYLWEALEELYARQGNTDKQKMAEKKVKELKN